MSKQALHDPIDNQNIFRNRNAIPTQKKGQNQIQVVNETEKEIVK